MAGSLASRGARYSAEVAQPAIVMCSCGKRCYPSEEEALRLKPWNAPDLYAYVCVLGKDPAWHLGHKYKRTSRRRTP